MFTKRQEAELITSIQGRGEIPLKFNYLGDGAAKWEAIAKKRSTGGINSTETVLLTEKIQHILSSFENDKINVIDIGCGDATPCYPMLDQLTQQGKTFRYIALDISPEMTSIAVKNVYQKYPHCETKEVVLDFEMGNFAEITYDLKEGGFSNLLCFLGSTVGNFSDQTRILTNLRDSMSSDDYLLIGVEMTNFSKVSKIIPHYKGEEAKDFVHTVASAIGIKQTDSLYSVQWNDRKNQIEIWAKLLTDCNISIGSNNFKLEKDEQILLARSVKFNEWTFTKILSDVGLRTELLTTTNNRGYLLSLVQPTRYNV